MTPAFCRYGLGALLPLLVFCLLVGTSLPGAADPAAASAPPATASSSVASALHIEVFVREGCPHCAKAEAFLEGLARQRPELRMTIRDVVKEPAAMQRLQDIVREQGGGVARVPAFFVGGQVIFGFSEEASTDKLLLFASNGRFYTIGCDKLPSGRGHGEPIRLSIDLPNDADAVTLLVDKPGEKLLVAGSDGRGPDGRGSRTWWGWSGSLR